MSRVPRGNSDGLRRRSAARATVRETEARLRAARSERDRAMLDGILDRARRALAQATADIERENG